jgi:imidazoleglycerol-phosphate dehydratase
LIIINHYQKTEMSTKRHAQIHRVTGETDILVKLAVDGSGKTLIKTGIPFFDHMLTLFGKHALFDLEVRAKGDTQVDFHHTVEDVGITLGQALARAIGDKKGMVRYGHFLLPMDETLARVALDFSGRPLLVWRLPKGVNLNRLKAGEFPAQLTVEFLRGLVQQAGLTLHVEVLYSDETHHLIESVFKAVARTFEQAVRRDPRVKGIPSTKGVL